MIINGTQCDYQSKLSNLPILYYLAVTWIVSFALNEQFDSDINLDASTIHQTIISICSAAISNELIATANEMIECSKRLPLDQINYNGYYLACSRCAPDRNNIISSKWHEIYKYIANVIQLKLLNLRYDVAPMRPILKQYQSWEWCIKQCQSHCQKYTDNSYGIAGSNQSYKNGQCSYELQSKTKVIIDMNSKLIRNT